MPATALASPTAIHNIGMAQMRVVKPPEQARAVLGSCVGLVLYAPQTQHGIMGHIVLPLRRDSEDCLGKFADSAVPEMVKMLRGQVGLSTRLIAKMAGGASMFNNKGPLQIGNDNIEAVRQALERLRIPVHAEHLGGNKGRRVTFDPATGEFCIEVQGQPTQVL